MMMECSEAEDVADCMHEQGTGIGIAHHCGVCGTQKCSLVRKTWFSVYGEK
jgi:hypothetical protein